MYSLKIIPIGCVISILREKNYFEPGVEDGPLVLVEYVGLNVYVYILTSYDYSYTKIIRMW